MLRKEEAGGGADRHEGEKNVVGARVRCVCEREEKVGGKVKSTGTLVHYQKPAPSYWRQRDTTERQTAQNLQQKAAPKPWGQ